MRSVAIVLIATTCAGGLALVGCGETEVRRTDANAVRDLSGQWNKTDSQKVANDLVPQILSGGWLSEFEAKNGRKPVLRPGKFVVRTQDNEVINQEIVFDAFREAFINSRKVTLIVTRTDAGEAREDRKDQDVHASATTRKESFQETAADFLLTAQINSQDDQSGKKKQKYYKISMSLVDVKTNEQVWLKSTEIAKDVER